MAATEARLDLARAYLDDDDYAAIEPLLEPVDTIALETPLALAEHDRALATQGPESDARVAAASTLVNAWREAGDYKPAIALCEEVLDVLRRRLPPQHPNVQDMTNLLGTVLELDGQLQAAETVLAGMLDDAIAVYGPDHFLTAHNQLNLANVVGKLHRYDEAVELAQRARETYEARFGRAHIRTLAALNTLAYNLEEVGRVDEAEATLRQIIAVQPEIGASHIQVLAPINNLAYLLMNQQRYDAANAEFARLIARAETEIGTGHPLYGVFESNQGCCLVEAGQVEAGIDVLREAVDRLNATLGPEHPRTVATVKRLDDAQAAAAATP